MVEHWHASCDVSRSGAVEIDRDLDLCFLRFAFYGGCSHPVNLPSTPGSDDDDDAEGRVRSDVRRVVDSRAFALMLHEHSDLLERRQQAIVFRRRPDTDAQVFTETRRAKDSDQDPALGKRLVNLPGVTAVHEA